MIETALQKEMLKAIRTYLEYRLLDEILPKLSDDPFYMKKYGLFVTLHKERNLRGCIGYIEGIKPLSEALFDMAESVAFHDPRFPALQADELKDIDIEISILSPLETMLSYQDIIIGKHGIIIKNGPRQAVFLPQVAPEQGWDLKTTLQHLCLKADLPVNAYLESDTDFYVFTAEVFSESS